MSPETNTARLSIAIGALLALTACGGSGPALDAGGRDAPSDDGGAQDGGTPPTCSDGCLVAGVCFPDGTADPANPCQLCDASLSGTSFSPRDGGACDDGQFCTVGDVCSAGVCTGAARDCDDGIACNGASTCNEASASCESGASICTGTEVCDAASGNCVVGCAGCVINGVCYGDGQVNPTDPCQRCVASSSSTAWSSNDGGTCDDGQFCTVGDVCNAGVCAGAAPRACDDGVACNGTESCSEDGDTCLVGATTCTTSEICDVSSDRCVASCTGCVIDGVCFGAGQRNPLDQCQVCAPSTSASAWSTNEGASCDDGLFCTHTDVCTGGACAGAARDCSDGIACNGVESCDETAGSCRGAAPICPSGQLCETATDSCITTCSGCVIAGVCYGADQGNPANPCEVCDTARSRTAWSANDGARCDDGAFCTDGDVCSARACAGSARSCSDGVACNGTETCDESADSCVAGTTTCAATEVCDRSSDTCLTTCAGCVIGGVCFADGTRNPLNECEICDAARSRAAFSANDGASCDDGSFCTRGDTCSGGLCAGSSTDFCSDGIACNGDETCNEASDRCDRGATTCAAGQACDAATDTCLTTCSGCVIGGVCYAAGTRDPSNQCQICSPSSSATAWTTNTGAACDDGLFCTTSDTCSAAATCGGSARSCSDGVSCNGTETCNESTDRCQAGSSTCASGQICNPATDTCLTTCSGCVIGGVCYAPSTINPANQCQICSVSSSTVAWTARTGSSCDDGQYCNTGETCSAAAACTGGSARNCSDGVTCNGTESCNESTDRCDAGTTTCTGGQICDPGANMCVLSCVGGTTLCGSTCVNTTYDPNNCQGCGNVCPAAANATPVCAGGCRYACDAGYANCNTTSPDCEVNTLTDSANCGSCGVACTGANLCINGTCAPPSNYAQVASPASWVDACATAGHTEYLPNDDDGSANFALPFDFYLWGALEPAGASGALSTNGWVAIPDDWSRAAFYTYLGDNYGRDPNICTAVVGSAPNRRFVIEWRDQLFYPPGSYGSSHVTYEMILNEADYSIDLLFNDVTDGRSQTIQIYNQQTGTTVGGCPGGGTNCLPTTGYSTRWAPAP